MRQPVSNTETAAIPVTLHNNLPDRGCTLSSDTVSVIYNKPLCRRGSAQAGKTHQENFAGMRPLLPCHGSHKHKQAGLSGYGRDVKIM